MVRILLLLLTPDQSLPLQKKSYQKLEWTFLYFLKEYLHLSHFKVYLKKLRHIM